jgi:hypothetical protein
MRTTEKHVLRPYLLIFLTAILVIVGFCSCQSPTLGLGTTLANNNANSNNASVVDIDTITVQLSTVVLDSFPTAGTGSMLLGHFVDNQLGTVTANSIFQIGIPSGTSGINNQSVYDSLVLMMRINKSFYGDTTKPQRYYVSQLKEVIQLPGTNQYTFYNNSSFSFDPSPLGHTDVRIFPTRGITSLSIPTFDTVKIQLPDTLGQHLMNMILGYTDTIKNINSFLSYFKGLTVYPDTDPSRSGALFGFKDTVIMRMFYHQPGTYTSYNFVDFPFYNKTYQFNRITVDRSGTPLAIVPTAQANRANKLVAVEIPSSNTNNACYVQSLTGVMGKVNFPTLSSIQGLPGYLGILKAQLILKPILGTFNPLISLPPQLALYQTNQNNQLGAPLTLNGSVQYGNLYTDYSGAAPTEYFYDITGYIKQQIAFSGGGLNLNGLMIGMPTSLTSPFNRAVFGDATNINYNISIKLYYISLPH